MAWINRLVLPIVVILATQYSQCGGAICEPVRIPMCQWLPYNLTRMPNLLYHSTQRNAILVIDQYQQLVNTNCSDSLLFFLCAMFAPMCPMGFKQEVIPPCRGVCEKARAGCEPILNRYNVSWPQELGCSRLPQYDRGVCISPESIVSTPLEGDAESFKATGIPPPPRVPQPECGCDEASDGKLRSKYMEKKYNYAMQATYKGIEYRRGEQLRLVVEPKKVLHRKKVKLPRGHHVRLWASSMCICPRLKKQRDYLFMGYEDRRSNKLLFTSDSHVEPWKARLEARITEWDQKLQNQKRRKKRRSTRRKKKSRGKSRDGDEGRRSRHNQRVDEDKTLTYDQDGRSLGPSPDVSAETREHKTRHKHRCRVDGRRC